MTELALPDPPLADAHVALRPFTLDDVDWVIEACRDPLVPRYTSVPDPYEPEHARAWIAAHEQELELHPTEGHTADGMAIWAPWAGVLVCGDYLSPVEIPMLSATGSRDAYLATLERLRPLVEQAQWVIPGHGAPTEASRALAILDEDVRYLTDWELPPTRRTAAQRALHEENRRRAA